MTRICGRGVCYIAAVALWVLLPPVDAAGEEKDGAAVAQLRGGPARTFAADSPFAIRFLENTELNQRLSEIARRSLEDSGYRPVSKSLELLPLKSVAPKFVLNVSVAVERKLALRPVGLTGSGGNRSDTHIQIDIRPPGSGSIGASKSRYTVEVVVIDNAKRRRWRGEATAHAVGDRYAITSRMLAGLIERLGKQISGDRLALE